jgi:hypothetical protein
MKCYSLGGDIYCIVKNVTMTDGAGFGRYGLAKANTLPCYSAS